MRNVFNLTSIKVKMKINIPTITQYRQSLPHILLNLVQIEWVVIYVNFVSISNRLGIHVIHNSNK